MDDPSVCESIWTYKFVDRVPLTRRTIFPDNIIIELTRVIFPDPGLAVSTMRDIQLISILGVTLATNAD